MKLLYAGNFEWPSEQARAIQTVHTTHALARAGASVQLLTIRPRSSTPLRPSLERYSLEPHPNFSASSVPVMAVPDSLGFIEIHKRLAITNLSYCLATVLKVSRMPRGNRPDWIFTRDPRVAWTFIQFRRCLGARVIYEVHELFGTRPRDNRSLAKDEQWGVADRTRSLEQTVLKNADKLITLTQACRQLIVDSYGIHQDRVTAIPDGTCPPQIDEVRTGTERTVIYVGQLYRWKGVDTLIRALAELPDTSLTVIGSGVNEGGTDVDRARLQRLASDLNVQKRVHFESFVPYKAVPARLSRAAVATVPLPDVLMSRYFTSPLKVFDAMAAGVPIVASDLNSIREVLRHEENGILVKPDSPQALAAGIRRLLDDRSLAAQLSAKARAEVAAYTWDARAKRILSFLADGHHGPAER